MRSKNINMYKLVVFSKELAWCGRGCGGICDKHCNHYFFPTFNLQVMNSEQRTNS